MYIIKGDERVNKILIAEDEAAIANLLRTVLTDAGYRCVWAPDGIQAADLLEQEPFDLALLDIMLPGADGYELLDYCKALDVPVIFLTALGEVEDRVRGARRITCPSPLPSRSCWPGWKRYCAAAGKGSSCCGWNRILKSTPPPGSSAKAGRLWP